MINVESYRTILKELESYNAELIAVSKTKPIEAIQAFYKLGQRHFGENRVQELSQKMTHLPKDIKWHMIGTLQRKKVKQIASFVHLIHSVDTLQLLEEINKQAKKHERTIDCLLQFHIAKESTKQGMQFIEACDLLDNWSQLDLNHVRIVGVMGMATFTNDLMQVRKEFDQLRIYSEQLKNKYFESTDSFREVSMGMSGDYQTALDSGSTMIRIGSSLFGER